MACAPLGSHISWRARREDCISLMACPLKGARPPSYAGCLCKAAAASERCAAARALARTTATEAA
eukprot:774491-Prymnesium_polylepis.1